MAKPKNGKGRAKPKNKNVKKNISPASQINNGKAGSGSSSAQNQVQTLPLPFPSQLPVPQGHFLRNEPPYEKSFQTALETSYLGLAVDDPLVLQQKVSTTANPNSKKKEEEAPPFLETLPQMNAHRFFQTDVTQPFGLGTKCAKTFVTRFLVGDPGTSYKYLGLRMFSYSWQWDCDNENNIGAEEKERRQLLQSIGDLKDRILVPQTQLHLKELKAKRQLLQQQQPQHGLPSYDASRSRPQYNICLINRMDSGSNDTDTAKNATAKETDTSTDSTSYKLEPTFEKDRIAVAWHADSSLEHYSNIAVYQLVLDGNDERRGVDNNDWSLALRVVPNAEGPVADQSSLTPDPSIPALCLALPSGSAYYMLDDFNHHHQHAVLRDGNNSNGESEGASNSTKSKEKTSSPNKPHKDCKTDTAGTTIKGDAKPYNNHHHHTEPTRSSTIRYSATYRLLRPSHTVQEVLEQCQRACRSFHKRGMKVWRSEQLLLTHIESEWLRQFYIQGQHHHDMLFQHGNWGTYMKQLWKYWSQLEQRTQQTLDLLKHAAEGKCHYHSTIINNAANQKNASSIATHLTKAERKKRDKQKKAFAAVQDLLLRTSASSSSASASKDDCRDRNQDRANNAATELYEPLAKLLDERATMRTLWHKREKDHVFKTMQRQYRPLPLPIRYADTEKDRDRCHTIDDEDGERILATSPLPEDLGSVATQLRAFGRAYQSGVIKDLPCASATACATKVPEAELTTISTEKSTVMPSDDNGLPVPTITTSSSSSNNNNNINNNSDSNPGGNHWRGNKKKKRQRDQGNKRTPDGGTKKKKRRF